MTAAVILAATWTYIIGQRLYWRWRFRKALREHIWLEAEWIVEQAARRSK